MSTIRCAKWSSKGEGLNGLPLCYCGCGREVLNKRRTTFEAACWNKWAAINHPPTIRRLVELRDKGVCALCGIDTEALQNRIRNIVHRVIGNPRMWSPNIYEFSSNWKIERVRSLMLGSGFDRSLSESWWDADHIIPVVEGGGQCGLDGYRTLCCGCHKAETAKLAKRRAMRRKDITK